MMQLRPRILALALATAATLSAADGVPLFNAMLSLGKEYRFVLVTESGQASSWLKLGDTFEGYVIKAYDGATDTLELERDGKTARVKLVDAAAIGNAPAVTPATLADAEEVFRLMRFDQMMARILEQQKKTLGPVMSQQMDQMAARLKLSDEEKAAFAAFQRKTFDDLMAAIMGPEMRAGMAKVYSEVFTKDELGSMAAFYTTPAGKALAEKTPDVSAKMQALMMPRMMQSMQKMAEASRAFAAELAAKRATAGGAVTPVESAPKKQ